jgi:hypothetical protein
MPSIITKNFSTELAQDFTFLFDIGANDYLPQSKKAYIFAILGKQIPWTSGTEVVPTPTGSIPSLVQCWDNAIVAKRMSLNDISYVVPRRNWTSNTSYYTYDSGNANYYVLNSKDQVFKCLLGNGTLNSTDEPQLFLSSTSLEEPYFQTTDGYKWKYMYTLNTSQKERFLTSEWMPVTYNKFVRASALNRSIDIVSVTNSGNNYVDGSTQSIISIVGDGTGAVLKANVANGRIQNVIVQSRGLNYTKANLVFTDITGGTGSAAAAVVSFSPQNGHGYDPIEELSANTIMLNVDFDGSESGDFPAENEFRQISLLKNPYVFGTSTLASSQLYNIYTKVNVSPGIGDFNNDEAISYFAYLRQMNKSLNDNDLRSILNSSYYAKNKTAFATNNPPVNADNVYRVAKMNNDIVLINTQNPRESFMLSSARNNLKKLNLPPQYANQLLGIAAPAAAAGAPAAGRRGRPAGVPNAPRPQQPAVQGNISLSAVANQWGLVQGFNTLPRNILRKFNMNGIQVPVANNRGASRRQNLLGNAGRVNAVYEFGPSNIYIMRFPNDGPEGQRPPIASIATQPDNSHYIITSNSSYQLNNPRELLQVLRQRNLAEIHQYLVNEYMERNPEHLNEFKELLRKHINEKKK